MALMLVPLPGQPLDPADALSYITNILNGLTLGLVGAVVAANLRENPLGWILLAAGLALAAESFLNTYTLIALSTGTETLRGGIAAAWVSEWIWIIPVCALVLLLHLFPTGTFLSPRWRWVALVSIVLFAGVVIPLRFSPRLNVFSARGELDLANPVGLFAFPNWVYPLMILPVVAALAGALSSMLLRFVRARGVERQQMKWFLYVAAIFVGSLILTFYQTAPIYSILVNVIGLGLPLSIGIAILRYRLWDIDIIIRRTITYSILTGLLALIYFGGVVLLQQLTRSFTESSDLAIVVSTLAIAALFFPLRRRVQNVIDRRFYRRKYDAAKTLAAFSATVRDETDLEKLTMELANVVNETMQPKSVGLWLRRTEREVTR